MDLKHPTTKIPDHETQSPPLFQSIDLLPFLNGRPHHHQQPQPQQQTAAAAYKECLKNHAVAIGGHALDGCGEFMLSPAYTTTKPSSFKCAACGCHRNFHRQELISHYPDTGTMSPASPPPEPKSYALGPHLLLSLSTAAEQNHVATPGTPVAVKVSGRKRFRTKFSQEQKEKMFLFAEKVGWKMQRCDDKIVADFCNEIGIKRRIFKVWMHNNKNISAKREKDSTTIIGTATATATTTITNTVVAALVRSNDSSHQENGSSSSS